MEMINDKESIDDLLPEEEKDIITKIVEISKTIVISNEERSVFSNLVEKFAIELIQDIVEIPITKNLAYLMENLEANETFSELSQDEFNSILIPDEVTEFIINNFKAIKINEFNEIVVNKFEALGVTTKESALEKLKVMKPNEYDKLEINELKALKSNMFIEIVIARAMNIMRAYDIIREVHMLKKAKLIEEKKDIISKLTEYSLLITDKEYKHALSPYINSHAYIQQLDEDYIQQLVFDSEKGIMTIKDNFFEPVTLQNIHTRSNIKELDLPLLRSLYTIIYNYADKIDTDTVTIRLPTLAKHLGVTKNYQKHIRMCI